MSDAEIAVQTFLEENVDANLEDLIAEDERIAEEHKENLASGKVKKVEEKTRPKLKGIIIKENVSSQSLQTRKIISNADLKNKGKAKVGEVPELKKGTSTSDKDHVDTQEDRSTSNKAQVEEQKQIVTTTDRAQVVQSRLSSAFLYKHFKRSSVSSQEIGYDTNSSMNLNVKAKT